MLPRDRSPFIVVSNTSPLTNLAAKANGLVSAVRPSLDDLRQKAGFYLSDSLYRHALTLANEITE
jgi:predicted nucleic acid-binding protein